MKRTPKSHANSFHLCSWLVAGVRWRCEPIMASLRAIFEPSRTINTAASYTLGTGHYDAERYWADRHRNNRHSFRGVGDIDRSDEENIRDYISALGSITQLFSIAPFGPAGKKVHDVCCGNGFWAGVFQEQGVTSYTGTHITDALFDLLRERRPHLTFMAGDLEQLPVTPGFELITMIDVIQHVTADAQLRNMLMYIRSLLAKNGLFIVTFWNQQRTQENFYETFRLFSFYTQGLDGMVHTQPIRFRDKFVATFCHQERHLDQVSPKSLPKESILEIAKRIVSPSRLQAQYPSRD